MYFITNSFFKILFLKKNKAYSFSKLHFFKLKNQVYLMGGGGIHASLFFIFKKISFFNLKKDELHNKLIY